MSNSDVLGVIETLLVACPSYVPSNVGALVNLWEQKFGDVEGDILRRAVDMHIDSSRFFPAPSQIKELLERAEYQVQRDRAEAAGGGLHKLRAQAVFLQEAWYQRGEYNRADWEQLISTYEKLGHEACAASERKRMEAIGGMA